MKNYKQGWYFPLLFKAVIIFTLSGLVYRCGTALYIPVMSDGERAGIAFDTLIKGRSLYIEHCGSCHNLHLPEKFTATEWEKNVSEMQEKAKINDLQKENMLYYLKSRCKN